MPAAYRPRFPTFAAVTLLFAVVIGGFSTLRAQSVDVLPASTDEWSYSLNGDWSFKYTAGTEIGSDADFFRPAFDVASWKTMPVPGHWELHGFAAPKYKRADPGTGLYRREFHTPASWHGRRVFLRFDGVLYGFDAWLNGVPLGSWASGYNPCTFDVTDALKPGANVLAVRVTTRCKGWEFDSNDCWALSGIYRDVTLFSTPASYLQDYTLTTALTKDGKADVHLSIAANNHGDPRPSMVAGRLRSPNGKDTREFQIPLSLAATAVGEVALTIDRPQLWTAETPNLYQLELTLTVDGLPLQEIHDRIGLREVTVADGILKLNGVPVKLRGIDHHDLWPDVGRAATEEHIRRDLASIREANINFIRTSHYPPHRRLLELCDEAGLYVICEVPFGYGDEHLTDPSYRDTLFTRARATVMRDKNHPSIIVWSVGNENPVTSLQLDTGREVKRLDSTRPICFPTIGGANFAQHYQEFPEFVDIYAPHYPDLQTLRHYANTLTRPVIVTEYGHALGLAADRIQELWEFMQSAPRLAGGAIWMFQDQGILRTAETPVDPAAPTFYVWRDERHYYDTAETDGADGIVYSDRTPQVDYWLVRKVYSPVQIAERQLSVTANAPSFSLHVQNRHDFRALDGLTLEWELRRNRDRVDHGMVALHAPAQKTEALSIASPFLRNPNGDVWALAISIRNEHGHSLYERSLRIEGAGDQMPATMLAEMVASDSPEKIALDDSATALRVAHARFTLCVDRRTGNVSLGDRKGETLLEGIGPHTGRKLTMAETLQARRSGLPPWQGSLLQTLEPIEATAIRKDNEVEVIVTGRYARPDTPGQFLDGHCIYRIRPNGTVKISYAFKPVNAGGTFLEAGLALALPASTSEFRWLGQGPYPGYPGKDRLNEFGLFHLNSGDLHFQGNRREVQIAALSRPDGTGIALVGDKMEIAVENRDHRVVLSHNALVAGRGNKGSLPATLWRAADVHEIAGEFTLLVLDDAWSAPMVRWFGNPGDSVTVQHPFFHSYDQ